MAKTKDERRWTLRRSHPMSTEIVGPQLELGESVRVVPLAASPPSQPEGLTEGEIELAIKALDSTWIIQADGDPEPSFPTYLHRKLRALLHDAQEEG